MFEALTIESESDLFNWIKERRDYYLDFDPDYSPWIHNGFPFGVRWVDGESNGYAWIDYAFFHIKKELPDQPLEKFKSILRESNIVWPKYGPDTIEELAKRLKESLTQH